MRGILSELWRMQIGFNPQLAGLFWDRSGYISIYIYMRAVSIFGEQYIKDYVQQMREPH